LASALFFLIMKRKFFFGAVLLLAMGAGLVFDRQQEVQAQNQGLIIGMKAPDISMEGPDGKVIKLSSLKGQMVLIDFWASWCGPCRHENPNVVKAYQEFKDKKFRSGKGFTVYSVSLDTNKDRWLAGIKQDNLVWDYHVSDLQGWKSAVNQEYGIYGIPMSFLIDGDGMIVGKNLRGPALEAKLKEFLK
jgi:thiol-disulfide isomerase/thioredoxin